MAKFVWSIVFGWMCLGFRVAHRVGVRLAGCCPDLKRLLYNIGD